MSYTDQVQCNAEQPPQAEASRAMLLQLLHQHAGGAFVLSTTQVAALIGKSEAAFRLFESRHRAKYGHDLMPKPLLQNAEGRVWSIAQIARWLAQDALNRQAETILPASIDKPAKRRGRPRKGITGELA